MTIREKMLHAAAAATDLLGHSAQLVIDFTRSCANPDGGFKGRSPGSDLYYTVFALETLAALQADMPTEGVHKYLVSFQTGDDLDLIHLACLVRCWANLPPRQFSDTLREKIQQNLQKFRTTNHGYQINPHQPHGSAYGCFLALGTSQELNSIDNSPNALLLPAATDLIGCLESLQCSGGGYCNDPSIHLASTAATAAAITVLSHLNQPIDPADLDWLLAQQHPDGGFRAIEALPIPDLLSTATAIHALAEAELPLDRIAEPCLDFVNSLWNGHSGFAASAADSTIDCEYNFYALLAIGHLARYN
ncbi:MAG: hypothetical protein JXD22_09325 [Sedimentisphaerales bacterium]|nr:hypothetical protein [Sedimentisphaerales bacterium]